MADKNEQRYITRNMVGDTPAGEVFGLEKFDAPQIERLLSLKAIEVYDPPTPVKVEEEEHEDAGALAKAKKDLKHEKARADKAEVDLKEAHAFADRVKAHVDGLADGQKKAFQDAVNAGK